MNFALGVSSDGRVVVGFAGFPSQAMPFRWTASDGVVLLDSVAGQSAAKAASADGSVIIGQNRGKPFRWTAATGLEFLSPASGAALSVSADGSVVVGYLVDPTTSQSPFVWTRATGLQPVPTPGYTGNLAAVAVSRNGMVIAIDGAIFPSSGGLRWTAGGIQEVPKLAGSSSWIMHPTALSFDGSILVGYGELGAGGVTMAFRWRPGSDPEELGVPSGDNESQAAALSEDGRTVVGYGDIHHTSLGPTPFVWREDRGLQDLTTYLAAFGVTSPAGSTLRICYGISRDAQVIVGNGIIPGYASGSFRAQICYANCDGSTSAPLLNVNDFQCFLTRFAAGAPYANCDASAPSPALNVADFICFLNRYASGCS